MERILRANFAVEPEFRRQQDFQKCIFVQTERIARICNTKTTRHGGQKIKFAHLAVAAGAPPAGDPYERQSDTASWCPGFAVASDYRMAFLYQGDILPGSTTPQQLDMGEKNERPPGRRSRGSAGV